jgi:hypothetical protein
MAYKYTSTTKGVVLLPLRKQHTITKTNYAINMYSNKVCAWCFKFWKIFLFHVRFNYFVENCFFVVSYPLQLYSKWKQIFVIFIMCCSYFGPNLSQMITGMFHFPVLSAFMTNHGFITRVTRQTPEFTGFLCGSCC